jgi:type II secretory pathway pseudopilin PulG
VWSENQSDWLKRNNEAIQRIQLFIVYSNTNSGLLRSARNDRCEGLLHNSLRDRTHARYNYCMRFSVGFTIIEMLVTIVIITTIAGIFLVNYNTFGSATASINSARDISAFFREAQIFSIGRREVSPGTDVFNQSYGVYIELTTPITFFMFVDVNGNAVYDSGEELALRLDPGSVAITELCNVDTSDCTLAKLVTIFQNGKTDAVVGDNTGTTFSEGTIRIRTGKGDEEIIEIYQNGNVFIQ